MAGVRPLVAGNWKSNGSRRQLTSWMQAFLAEYRCDAAEGVDILVCPPTVYLDCFRSVLPPGMAMGAQNVSAEAPGAFTGEVTAGMLRDAGCSHVIIGHSERRQGQGETDAAVAQKYLQARRAGLQPLLCVGETRSERRAGATEAVVRRQLEAVLKVAEGDFAGLLAYEPVWAIGTGATATPAEAGAVQGFIRRLLSDGCEDGAAVRLLYGGSVDADKVAGLLAQPDIDGVLVGGASLVGAEFAKICRRALMAE